MHKAVIAVHSSSALTIYGQKLDTGSLNATGSGHGAGIGGTGGADSNTTSQLVDLAVSPGAAWKMYQDVACTEEILDRTMILAEGANLIYK